jgi:uncharacterized membrane protein YhhN
MTDNAAPSGPSLGNQILDTVIGLWAMLLLLPAIPILVLVWLWDRLKSKKEPSED